MKSIINLIALISLTALAGCSSPTPDAPANGKPNVRTGDSANTPTAQNSPGEPTVDPKRTLSLAQYDKITVGLAPSEVEEIIGWRGVVTGGSETEKSTTVMWKTEGIDAIIVVFADNKMLRKTQFNLK